MPWPAAGSATQASLGRRAQVRGASHVQLPLVREVQDALCLKQVGTEAELALRSFAKRAQACSVQRHREAFLCCCC